MVISNQLVDSGGITIYTRVKREILYNQLSPIARRQHNASGTIVGGLQSTHPKNKKG